MGKDQNIRYKVARTFEQLCGLLNIDTGAVLRRMGRPADFFEADTRGVTPADYFAGWDAMMAEVNRPDIPLMIGQAYARGPFNPAFFAFTCSPTVVVGLERLALFKPLTGPLRLALHRTGAGDLVVTKTSNVADIPLPASFAATELVFLMEAIRICTGQAAQARAATLVHPVACLSEVSEFIGCPITLGPVTTLTLPAAVADRPLLSSNADYWAQLEPGFRRQISQQKTETTVTARLRVALTEMLPAGQSNVGDAAQRLAISARSLQRHLKQDGTTYQLELNSAREALARQYLSASDLNIDEISFLLAYRDPNSFYRAFQAWTGQTPGAFRAAVTPTDVAAPSA
ncbi:helix-turn-helix domain-containing protein [Tateyamaria sp. SN6-1]|uniref:helix-turn-helix domain-containing protein n=1 Tax=Tateyamaria sp. SN6-1 TaxID=3092148 RepID=UPI0039F58080